VRRAVIAMLFVLASAAGAGAETTCRFEAVGTTMRLLGDCITDTSIAIPDGITLDGGHHAIVALDPIGGTFRGAVVVAAGRTGAIVDTVISALMLGDTCQPGAARLRGIYFNGASGWIRGNVVTGINKGAASACEDGHAIEVRNGDPSVRGRVEIDHNTIDGYQKAGIVVTGAVDVSIHHNDIGASATQTRVPANGVQLGPGAGGVIELNTIRGNSSGAETAGTAVLLARSAPGTIVRANSIIGNADVGIYMLADDATVEANELTDTGIDGAHDIGIGNYGSRNRVTGNMVRGFATRYQGVAVDPAVTGRTVALE
jgi:hypothetical protein